MIMTKKQLLRCDCHTHILPDMDDGAKDAQTAVEMLKITRDYGVGTVLLTPHYFSSAESADAFLTRRDQALLSLRQAGENIVLPRLICGAEVHLEQGISELPSLERLCIGDTGYLLLEMPYFSFHSWMLEEAENIYYRRGIKLILAHLPRYLSYFDADELDDLISLPETIVQVNAEDMLHRPSRKMVEQWMANDVPVLFGSDCHNLHSRRPNLEAAASQIGRKHRGFCPAYDANARAEQIGLL